MDFNDTPEEAEFRAKARAWLETNAPKYTLDEDPATAIMEGEEPIGESYIKKAKAWQAKKADDGWACLTWPKAFGGQGLRGIFSIIYGQEEGKYNLPGGIFGIGLGMCGPTVIAHGTKEQKERWIPKLARGEEIWCQLFSEPGAGSDLAGLRMRAEQDGDEWVVNGQKVWTTGAHYSDWGILVTRSDPNMPKHKGLTYFVVNMHSPGIEVRPIRQITGGASFNEVFFSDVRIPDDQRLGAVGNGWSVAITTLMNERASIGAGGGGGGGIGINGMLKLAGETYIGDKPAIEHGSVRERIADFYTRAKGLEYTGHRILTAISRGGMPGPEASIAKLVGAKMGQDLAALGMELQEESGTVLDRKSTLNDAGWQRAYLWAPGLRVAGGTDEILRNIIGERVLGLPRDPRSDKGIPFKDIPTGTK